MPEGPHVSAGMMDSPARIGLPVRTEKGGRGNPTCRQATGGEPTDQKLHYLYVQTPGNARVLCKLRRVVVRVRDSRMNSKNPRKKHDHSPEVIHMAVHGIVGSEAAQHAPQAPELSPRIPIPVADENPRSQLFDLGIVGARLFVVNNKVDHRVFSVNVPKHMHQPRLSTSTIGAVDNL
jgi:hypothetical protein